MLIADVLAVAIDEIMQMTSWRKIEEQPLRLSIALIPLISLHPRHEIFISMRRELQQVTQADRQELALEECHHNSYKAFVRGKFRHHQRGETGTWVCWKEEFEVLLAGQSKPPDLKVRAS